MTSLQRRGIRPGTRSAPHSAPVANRAALRALSILDLLSRSDEPMTLGEVATQLKLPKSSALTLLRALVVTEFCAADEKGFYALGLHSFEVGAAYLRSMTPVRSVIPELQWLTESLGVTSHFAVLDRDEVTYLAKHDPPGSGPEAGQFARCPTAGGGDGGRQGATRLPRSGPPGWGARRGRRAQAGGAGQARPVGVRARTGKGAPARLRRRRRADGRRDPVRGCSRCSTTVAAAVPSG